MNHIKLFTTIVFVFLFFSGAFSQDSNVNMRWTFSPGITKLYGHKYISEYDSKLGLAIGLDFEFVKTSRFSIETGLNFAIKGMKSQYNVFSFRGSNNLEFRSNFNYLIAPLLAKFKNDENTFYVETGPYFGFLLSQIDRAIETGLVIDQTDEIKRLDVGWSLGIGLLFPITEGLNFQLGIKENLGLLDLSKFPLYPEGSIKTTAFEFNFGLIFKL